MTLILGIFSHPTSAVGGSTLIAGDGSIRLSATMLLICSLSLRSRNKFLDPFEPIEPLEVIVDALQPILLLSMEIQPITHSRMKIKMERK
jgi:hypothetical protein